MASYPIEGWGVVDRYYAAKLKAAGVRSTRKLLDRAGSPSARRRLAEASGIAPDLILKWAHLADLMRVKGVADDYARLLASVGVDTLKELRRRSAGRLAERLAEANRLRPIVELLPSEKRVARWIEEAKTLEPMVTF
jgi:hypothetical protein